MELLELELPSPHPNDQFDLVEFRFLVGEDSGALLSGVILPAALSLSIL